MERWKKWLLGAVAVLGIDNVMATAEELFPYRTTRGNGDTEAVRTEAGVLENPFEDAIETDRDSFTPSTMTVAKRRITFETSYSFIDNRGTPETHSFPEVLIRYGLFERLELRFGWNYEVGGGGDVVSGLSGEEFEATSGITRESRLLYGLKYSVNDQVDWIPQSAVILQGFTPTSGENNNTEFLAAYVFGWELPFRTKLDAAMRYGTSTEEGDHFNTWAPSAVFRLPVGDRLAFHAEYFGEFSTGRAGNFTQHFFSPGVHVLLSPDIELGVRLGWGLNDQSARFFSNVGVGVRY